MILRIWTALLFNALCIGAIAWIIAFMRETGEMTRSRPVAHSAKSHQCKLWYNSRP